LEIGGNWLPGRFDVMFYCDIIIRQMALVLSDLNYLEEIKMNPKFPLKLYFAFFFLKDCFCDKILEIEKKKSRIRFLEKD